MSEPITWTNEKRRLSQLIPWPRNPRQIKTDQAKRLVESFDQFGQVETIAIGPDNGVYNGHQRLNVLAQKYGKDYEVEVRVASRPLDEKEREKLTIFLHKGAAGDWDWDSLANNFEIPDLLDWGFSEKELQLGGFDLNEPEGDDPGAQMDKAEELRQKWGVESGQLWRLGEHRLICGDCTDRAVVERVMGGEKAQMLFTSPPYAAQRDYEIGDFDWDALMLGMSTLALGAVNETGAILVNLGLVHREKRVIRYWDDWLAWMDKTDWPLFDWYVWDKINGLMGDWRGRLAPAHEWIFHFANKPREANKTEQTKYAENGITHYKKDKVGLREKNGSLKGFTQAGMEVSQFKIADSVIRCQPARGGVEGHPAPFSIEFAESLIGAFTHQNEQCYEPFNGSGTTLIACERLHRKCRAVEISPAYCAVAIERWQQMTGGTPELLESVIQTETHE